MRNRRITRNGYMGWKNYATWRISLELFDDPALIREDFPQKPRVDQAAEYLQSTAEELIAQSGDDSLAFQYAMAFIEDVDWHQIAEKLIEEAY